MRDQSIKIKNNKNIYFQIFKKVGNIKMTNSKLNHKLKKLKFLQMSYFQIKKKT